MSTVIDVQRLSLTDLPHNVALSNSVGWPDTDSEWRVIHDAALVLGVRRDEQLIGQGALGLYEGACTIAKMVVSEAARRQGIGAAILQRLMAEAERRGTPVVGLVATAPGRPLYESRGFTPVGDVAIVMGTPAHGASADADEGVTAIDDAEQILAVERRYIAGSRAAVLRGRLRDACATALSAGGFALATPHDTGARIGPIIADSEASARSLTLSLFRQIGGPVRLDVPGERRAFRHWLQGLGLVEKGINLEMAHGGMPPWNVAQRFGLALQAWG